MWIFDPGAAVLAIDKIVHHAGLQRARSKQRHQGDDVVVILSAMAGVTDRLIGMASQVTDTPDKRELDVLLATGEQTTAALLAMTLRAMNYAAESILGHQAKVVTDCAFGNARILDIGADPIRALVQNRKIVVMAGFQGCDINGNITTLGRGGSDTSAVAIAAAIKAAQADTDKPSLIICRSHIGYGSPNKQGTAATHGSALGPDEVAAARETLNWPHAPFEVPADVTRGALVARVEPGSPADLVIWSGDPLDVTSAADQVVVGGRAVPMVSRQTLLRDRYLGQQPEMPRAYVKP